MKSKNLLLIVCLLSIASAVWGRGVKPSPFIADRFTEESGFLRDSKTGLEWNQADNGFDINWNEATAFCTDKGSAWRLPTNDELLGIYDKTLSVSCGGSMRCRTAPSFRLSKSAFWSSERNSSGQAWLVLLSAGLRDTNKVDFRSETRALCVRRP